MPSCIKTNFKILSQRPVEQILEWRVGGGGVANANTKRSMLCVRFPCMKTFLFFNDYDRMVVYCMVNYDCPSLNRQNMYFVSLVAVTLVCDKGVPTMP